MFQAGGISLHEMTVQKKSNAETSLLHLASYGHNAFFHNAYCTLI
jgi:hypothetical protein